jgi:GT2 family glycosyltransferase
LNDPSVNKSAEANGPEYYAQRGEQVLAATISDRDRLLMDVQRLQSDLQNLARENAQAQGTLQAILGSRAWRLAEKGRTPFRKMRQDWPRVYNAARFVARTLTGRRRKLAAKAAGSSQPLASPGPDSAGHRAGLFSQDNAYQRWIIEQEPTAADLDAQRESAESMESPLFSIVVPVSKTDHAVLKTWIESVLNQTYRRWELCIAMTPDDDKQNRNFLGALGKQDARVRLTELTEDKGTSSNTNAALDLASGEFIALLDNGDALAPFALFEMASRIKTQSTVDLIYSDHDYLDPQHGLRRDPLFKPDWSPEIMFSANYISHLTVLRRSLLESLGRFDPATDGAQDWDLFLRITEKTRNIAHIPKILYHRRMHDSVKNDAADAQLLALRRHMERTGLAAEPEMMPNALLHVRFKQRPSALVSIIIPTKDRLDLLCRCMSSLLELTSYDNFEIIIVDNGSKETATKEYFRSLEGDKRIRLLWHPGPFNYTAIHNRAAIEANGELLLFLSNDVEITRPDWLTELVCWANQPAIGIVGAKLLFADGTIQHAGVVVGMSGFADHPFINGPALAYTLAGSTGWYRDFLAVTGDCMLMRRQVFYEIGGLDEDFVVWGADVEMCLRAHQRGYRNVYNPFAELIQHEPQSHNTQIPEIDFVESLEHSRRWLLSGDPYWSANLSLLRQQPTFRHPNEQSSFGLAQRHVESLKASGQWGRTEEESWVSWFDCSAEQFQLLRAHNPAVHGLHAVKRLLWFISPFEVPFYGGIYTILRFCDYWKHEKNIEIFFAVCGSSDRVKTAALIRQVYADVQDGHVFVLDNPKQAAELPAVDACICTLWTTPYFALHQTNVGRRFYLIQDFEPSFYRAGSVSAIVESTYRMGLYGIANTISLKQMYEAEYGGKATYFNPTINTSVFHPAESPQSDNPRRPLQVFCYGRPKHPRNAFELVKQAMKNLKARLGDKVRIVSAGDEWQPSEYGLQGIVQNLGLLSYEETGRLYRESQVGVVMMLTRHPSYLPLELMASGCLTVTNVNSWTGWLLKDGENCLLATATATALTDTVERALLNPTLREAICKNALATVRSEYLDWAAQAESVFQYLCDPESAACERKENGRTPRALAITAD